MALGRRSLLKARVWLQAWLMGVTCAALTSAPLWADTIPVRSGEHEGFSRLVLEIGPERTWRISETDAGAAIHLDPAPTGYDTESVFTFIPRTRVSAISVAADAALILDLACPCVATGFRHQEHYLVVDIAPADPPEQPPAGTTAPETSAPPVTPPADPFRVAEMSAAEQLPDLGALLTRPFLSPAAQVAEAPETAAAAPSPEPSVSTPDPVTPTGAMPEVSTFDLGTEPLDETPSVATEDSESTTDPADISIEAAAAIMAEQLARAAASGLLEAAPGQGFTMADPVQPTPPPPLETTPPDPEAPDSAPPAPMEPEATSADDPTSPPLRAATAFDGFAGVRVEGLAPAPGTTCLSDHLNVADWAGSAGFVTGLGTLRAALYDDRDTFVPDAAEALARHYLFHGFGAEAIYWLSRVPEPDPALIGLGHMLDGTRGAPSIRLRDRTACGTAEAFWRYAMQRGADPLSEPDLAQLQQTFLALPPHLRDHLGPTLARRLSADGHPRVAMNLRDSLARGGRLSGDALLRLDLDLGLTPHSDDTMEALASALRDAGSDTATAMAQMLRATRVGGFPSDPTRIDAAEALLREEGVDTADGDLWTEVVLAHAREGDVVESIAMILAEDVSEARRRDTTTVLLATLTEIGDTAGLSAAAHSLVPRWQAEGSAAGRTRVAAINHLRAEGLMAAADRLRAGQRVLVLPATETAEGAEEDALTVARRAGDWTALEAMETGATQTLAARMVVRSDDALSNENDPADDGLSTGITRVSTETGAPDLDALDRLVADSAALRDMAAGLLSEVGPLP